MVPGLVQTTSTWTRRKSPSTETLRTSPSFDPMGHWSMHPSGPVCTSDLPPVLSALTEKGLPVWNGEKKWTVSTFLDWLQGDSLCLFSSKGISCSKTPIEHVEFSLLLLHISFNSVHGKTTYKWQTDDIRVHMSDIRITCEYIRVTYE